MGEIAAKILASGDGWSACDLVCTAGPRDRPYEEQHSGWSIAVVVGGSFKYHSNRGAAVMSPGALLLGNCGEYFECSHEHATGDRCLSFRYTPEFFAGSVAPAFRIPRIPALSQVAPWAAMAQLAVRAPQKVNFDELACGLVGIAVELQENHRKGERAPGPADQRRISSSLRLLEAHFNQPLRLRQLASAVGMSDFQFLRTFRQVTGVTPHQYLLRTRLRAAALSLATRPAKVLEIALASGFEDLSNFNHAFRAEFGVNPRAFIPTCPPARLPASPLSRSRMLS